MSDTPKTPMTKDEATAVAALKTCTFPIASWDKRFVRDITTNELSDKQRPQVWRLFVRYRRQINCPDKARILALAEKLAAPDFRKVNAAANEKARIDELKRQQTTATP